MPGCTSRWGWSCWSSRSSPARALARRARPPRPDPAGRRRARRRRTLPFVPEVRLTAELVLVGLLPPLLYNAALQTSLVDFTAHRRSILSLSVGLVVFTTAGVAVVVHALLPDVGWPAAFALGAVVAPPDAVAATAIARRIGLPRRDRGDPRGRVAAQRRHGAGGAQDRDPGRRRRGDRARHRAGLRPHRGRRRGVRRRWSSSSSAGCAGTSPSRSSTPRSRSSPRSSRTSPPRRSTPPACWPWSSPGCCSATRRRCIQTPSSRIAERLNWRTISFLLENAVFLLIGLQTQLDPRRGRRQRRWAPAAIARALRGGARRRRACCGWCGCSRPATC